MNIIRSQRGLTIPELLVAVAVGTLVALLGVTLLVSASSSYVAHTEQTNLDDAGRFALSTLERAARQTGFADWETEGSAAADPYGAPPILGLDAASLSPDKTGIADPRPPAVNGSDVLALRFAGSGSADGDGSATTCAGFAVGAGQEGWSIFYVSLSARGDPELRCKYRGANGWGADAVVGGVDSFQVLYGLDTDAVADGQANHFATASQINALDAGLTLDGDTEAARSRDQMRKTHWKRVASLKVALVLHGSRRSKSVGADSVLHLFGAAYSAGAAGDIGVRVDKASMKPALRDRERRTFSATILLRNQLR